RASRPTSPTTRRTLRLAHGKPRSPPDEPPPRAEPPGRPWHPDRRSVAFRSSGNCSWSDFTSLNLGLGRILSARAGLLNQRRQLDSQRLIRSKEQRFQGAFGAMQDLADLRVIQLLIFVQQHRGALLFRQCIHRAPDQRRAVARQKLVL